MKEEKLIDNLDWIKRLGKRVATQNCRATADPLFIAEEKVRIWNIDPDMTDRDGFVWVQDGEEIKEGDEGFDEDEAEQHSYLEAWKPIQTFMTEVGAKEFLAANYYHYPLGYRTYVIPAWRNDEMLLFRELLLDRKLELLQWRPMLTAPKDGTKVIVRRDAHTVAGEEDLLACFCCPSDLLTQEELEKSDLTQDRYHKHKWFEAGISGSFNEIDKEDLSGWRPFSLDSIKPEEADES